MSALSARNTCPRLAPRRRAAAPEVTMPGEQEDEVGGGGEPAAMMSLVVALQREATGVICVASHASARLPVHGNRRSYCLAGARRGLWPKG